MNGLDILELTVDHLSNLWQEALITIIPYGLLNLQDEDLSATS